MTVNIGKSIVTDVSTAQLGAKVDNRTVVNDSQITLSVDTSRIHIFDKQTEQNMLAVFGPEKE